MIAKMQSIDAGPIPVESRVGMPQYLQVPSTSAGPKASLAANRC